MGPKLQLSFLNTIQMCRPKYASSLVQTPLPPLTHSSKIYDISLPTSPSSPPHHNFGSSKIAPMHRPISNLYVEYSSQAKSYNSHCSSEANDEEGPWHNIAPSKIEKAIMKKPKAKVKNTSISLDEKRRIRTARFKRFGSKECGDGSTTEVGYESRAGPGQSFVVVKRSVDPSKDFKKSMLEMILEREMFEPKELEQLLMSFLSLNSRMHHKAILEAFTEIWKELFS